jgi:hypothetical protein
VKYEIEEIIPDELKGYFSIDNDKIFMDLEGKMTGPHLIQLFLNAMVTDINQ